jgi:hypothetical protein
MLVVWPPPPTVKLAVIAYSADGASVPRLQVRHCLVESSTQVAFDVGAGEPARKVCRLWSYFSRAKTLVSGFTDRFLPCSE